MIPVLESDLRACYDMYQCPFCALLLNAEGSSWLLHSCIHRHFPTRQLHLTRLDFPSIHLDRTRPTIPLLAIHRYLDSRFRGYSCEGLSHYCSSDGLAIDSDIRIVIGAVLEPSTGCCTERLVVLEGIHPAVECRGYYWWCRCGCRDKGIGAGRRQKQQSRHQAESHDAKDGYERRWGRL